MDMNLQIQYSEPLANVLELWRKADEENDPEAQYGLAMRFLRTESRALHRRAVELLKKAARQRGKVYSRSLTDALFALGCCYELGRGIRKNARMALRWYREAEDHISSDMWRNPDPVGEAEAEWFSRCMEDEAFERYVEDDAYRRVVDRLLERPDYDSPQGLRAAAERGDPKAEMKLGHECLYGKTPRDLEGALYWYLRAEEHNEESAALFLSKVYEELKDMTRAAMWYRKYAARRIRWRNTRLGW